MTRHWQSNDYWGLIVTEDGDTKLYLSIESQRKLCRENTEWLIEQNEAFPEWDDQEEFDE